MPDASGNVTVKLTKEEFGYVLAGVMLLQHFGYHGRPPTKEEWGPISTAQGEGMACLTPEDADDLLARLRAA